MLEKFPVLQKPIFGNTLEGYLIAAAVFLGGLLIVYLLDRLVFRRLMSLAKKAAPRMGDFFIDIFGKSVMPLFYFGVFYFAVKQLVLNPAFDNLVNALWVILLTIQVTRVVLAVVLVSAQKFWLNRQDETRKVSRSVLTILKVVIWGLGLVFILDNLGFNISAVVAGLGIGGVAVALAGQTILGDLFNYFVIFMDKPFEEGDFIIAGDDMGMIEHIGVKTTRIRSLGGEELVIANSDLASSRIRNYKRMDLRRVLFKIGVVYQTPLATLKKIPSIIQGIIAGIGETRFDRAHFKEFAASSLDFEVVYFVAGSDYNKYMDIQQRINFEIAEVFGREGIEFAYPTQTLYLSKEDEPKAEARAAKKV